LSREDLREVEDRAALANLAMLKDVGMTVFTDGEVRRANWMAGALEALGGVEPVDAETGLGWHRDGGDDPDPAETKFQLVAARERLTRKVNLTATEASFLLKNSPGRFKITMMSASMGTMLWAPGLSDAVYPTPGDVVTDLATLQAEEIAELVGLGVTWVQLDSLSYMSVIDEGFAAGLRSRGVSITDSLARSITVDNQQVRAARKVNPDVTVGLHFCRGNNRSAWAGKGGYEPVAERLFGEVEVDRFLLEFDTERAGGFEPLRFVPAGRTVVLGLVSSKTPVLESVDALRRRVDEAARYVPLENLAISPQCGFASTAAGNLLTLDDQRRKLDLVVQTAARIWG
jgi:5-methyltetrahydropteroyltriglutamate--homocysteine methyltransferase